MTYLLALIIYSKFSAVMFLTSDPAQIKTISEHNNTTNADLDIDSKRYLYKLYLYLLLPII